jgi:large subunit ribosomal protein L7e
VTRDTLFKTETTKARATRREDNKKKRADYLKRAQTYRAEYEKADRDLINNRRKARSEGGFFVAAEAKVALVVRIRGINKLHPDIKKILRLFRLRQLHNATFLKINKASANMLRKVEPYVTFGYPTRKVISDLIYKRGFGKLNKQRIPLTTNQVVEAGLGKLGIICVEDLIHEIITCGPHFKEANNFLWPFKLRCPKGGFVAKRHAFTKGGDFGNREELVNELVKRML